MSATADALATAFYVLGVEKTEQYCREHPEVSAVLTTPGKHRGAMVLHRLGLDDSQWRQVAE